MWPGFMDAQNIIPILDPIPKSIWKWLRRKKLQVCTSLHQWIASLFFILQGEPSEYIDQTVDYFLDGMGRNQVHSIRCSTQTAHKPI